MSIQHPRRVMVVYGTRPEAIKMAPLVHALQASPGIQPVVVVTGQHREMLDQVNQLFRIQPDVDLALMKPGATLTDLSSRTLVAMDAVLGERQPDAVVVQGDTSTAFVAALAAFYHRVPVVHLEAGLRTNNLASPFPEEGNRRLIGPLAALHLAPTPHSRENLLRENVAPGQVVVTGNTVIDALHWSLGNQASFADRRVAELVAGDEQILLVTTHRRESWGEPMRHSMTAVRELARRHPRLRIVLPMHRNQLVRDVIEPILGDLDQVVLTEPLDYHEFTHLINASHVVLTDSGGVQEEAPSLGKPVLVLRDTTERPEAVTAGTVKLVGTDERVIVDEVSRLLDDPAAYRAFAQAVNPYGDGHAAARSTAAIAQMLGVGSRIADFDPRLAGVPAA